MPERERLRATLSRLPRPRQPYRFFAFAIPAMAVMVVAVFFVLRRPAQEVAVASPFDEQELTQEEQAIQSTDAEFEAFLQDLELSQ